METVLLQDQLGQLETETFEVLDLAEVGQEYGIGCAPNCALCAAPVCSTSTTSTTSTVTCSCSTP